MRIGLLLFLLLFICAGCHQQLIQRDLTGTVTDGKYDSEFPIRPVSEHLRTILGSVHLVSVLTFYKSYSFARAEAVTEKELRDADFALESRESVVFEQPASGTATLIYNDQKKIAFLTCAHIIEFPDTMLIYHRKKGKNGQLFVKNFIKKVKQIKNIINQPVAYNFDILSINQDLDLAIVGKDLDPGDLAGFNLDKGNRLERPISVLNAQQGRAEELDWGTFVYLIGFPRAKKMVTSAIVSNPNYDLNNSFLLDASMQKGISGGLVFAIRDGVPNFELVGMAVGISGRVQYTLVPEALKQVDEWESHGVYDGPIYIEKQEIAEPGMIYIRSIESILSFLDQSGDILKENGYMPELFFK